MIGKRKIIEIDEDLCDGCGQCIPGCAEGALEIIDGKARLVADKYCDGLGACLGDCPTGALKVVEKTAEFFDEEAVEIFLKEKKEAAKQQDTLACGCPSTNLQSFPAQTSCQKANEPQKLDEGQNLSALSHWPVQIRLVPPTAPFLKNADLLIAADCTPIAYPDFHRDFLTGRVVMMGCPKFDDQESYIAKFAEIFLTADIKSITSLIMEVPCCGSMRGILDEAMKRAGKKMDVNEVMINARGEILKNQTRV